MEAGVVVEDVIVDTNENMARANTENVDSYVQEVKTAY